MPNFLIHQSTLLRRLIGQISALGINFWTFFKAWKRGSLKRKVPFLPVFHPKSPFFGQTVSLLILIKSPEVYSKS